MDLHSIPEMFQSKLRLMIISALIKEDCSFNQLKQITGATDGNLSVQISKLSEAGFVTTQKEFVGKKPLTTCQLTEEGRDAFRQYVEMLSNILSAE